MNKEIIVDTFIKRFILKNRRDRVEFELKNPEKRIVFIDRLNHVYEKVLDMKYFQRLDPELATPDLIQKEMKLRDNDNCYLISPYEDFDDKIIDFKSALGRIYAKGLGALIINLTVDRVYLETEIGPGSRRRFVGKRLDVK